MVGFEASAIKDDKRIDVVVIDFLQDHGCGTLAVCVTDFGKLFTCSIRDVTIKKDSCGNLKSIL